MECNECNEECNECNESMETKVVIYISWAIAIWACSVLMALSFKCSTSKIQAA